ncbi:glycoside hydrolase family 47 protein [Aaosphaeria arxii CBS 175.79]|uniref:alpha-1,2-Mannosidase n=1 Tax=Aaosphaeria arxii CBS 175.79 TaxID=1450172 RepID=A0A6A5XNB9_9PLEO|nr:glycoside hydrolase family 47 protein [Aaosphaeria arxii CBS 175.79]KAF2014347.1 glycoside hydrolase family 47 protein [Aaosphaeria arxii CBS 175.79]
MAGFRRWGKAKFQRNPNSSFKLLAALIVISIYLLTKEFSKPTFRLSSRWKTHGADIQFTEWQNGTNKAETARANKVREAMKYTFWQYRENAWGADDIRPVTGGNYSSRNGWGAFIVDASTTLAVMGLWEELAMSVDFIQKIDFNTSKDYVDPFETTIRYLGGLVSLVDLADAGVIPDTVITSEARDKILQQAVTLANALGPAYDSPTGMPWPRVNLELHEGVADPPWIRKKEEDFHRYDKDNTVIGPARTGSSILENRVLTRLTGDSIYVQNATNAWAPLIWSKWVSKWRGLPDAPIDIVTGAPTARHRHWDGGHDSFYEYLVKITLLAPRTDPYLKVYQNRFIDAAYSLRKYLSSRSAPAPGHYKQHLFIGKSNDEWYLNEQGHLACFAPGALLLGSKFYDEGPLRTFALALLEGCRHTYAATPSGIGPESWSWIPKFGYDDPMHTPRTDRAKSEWKTMGFWSQDPAYKNRPEYVESLFYAYRMTGEQRYRDWAWEAFSAMEKYSKAPYGYAQLVDVFRVNPEDWNGNGTARWIDEQESYWAAETLKYLYLTFSDVEKTSLDRWVFNTEGHMFRMIR